MQVQRAITCVILAMIAAGCGRQPTGLPAPLEAALQPGQSIVFRNDNGSGRIDYVSPLERRYTFDSEAPRVIRLIARKGRFNGVLGLYDPATKYAWEFWKGKRIVTREAERHFDSMEALEKSLIEGSAIKKWVYNDAGYVVGFSRTPERDQIGITLYRYFLNGSVAHGLPGSQNDRVVLTASS